jgi:hypothetical protein
MSIDDIISGGQQLFIGGTYVLARIGTVRFWAERGLVHWEDAKDNSYGSISARDAFERIVALRVMLDKPSEDKDIPRFRDYRNETQTYIEDMLKVIRLAREQGTPTDPTAKHATTTRVVVPEYCFGGLD